MLMCCENPSNFNCFWVSYFYIFSITAPFYQVYCEVVGGLLEFLVMHYHTSPEVKLIFDDIILCREAVSLLEAHLLVNMSNYTDSLLKSIVSLDTENLYSTLFEVMHKFIIHLY